MIHDYCVIGGGIVGLATAMALLERRPEASLVLLEKEPALARHQTGHNSGVIHSGIYYVPGSHKAVLCKRGAAATKAFCRENGISFEECGKLLVATSRLELDRLAALRKRAAENGIEVEPIGREALGRIEPDITGLGALRVPSAGIVDYRKVCAAMARKVRQRGGDIVLSASAKAIRERESDVEIFASGRSWRARHLIACAGLQSDRVARLAGLDADYRIVPFRGEYFRLPASWSNRIRHLIYPVPDPELPFLGIHLTRMIDGSVTVGPNAVLGLSREGERKLSVSLRDVIDYAAFPGLWRTLWQHRRFAASELINSVWKRAYLKECRKYCPTLEIGDLLPYPAGVRAQAVLGDGTLVHDFLFKESRRMLHVCNAPSPAATSAIPIGEMIADRVMSKG